MAKSSAKGIRAGRAFVEVFADTSPLVRGLRQAQASIRNFGSAVQHIGLQATAVGASITVPLLSAAQQFSNFVDSIAKMARRTGLSAESVSALSFAAQQSGADVASLEVALRMMQRQIGDAAAGMKEASDSFARVGISVRDLAGLKPEDQLKLIAERMSAIADPALRASAAMRIFGRSGTSVLPLLEGGAAGIEELTRQAGDFGLTISGESAAAAEKLNDTLSLLSATIRRTVAIIGESLAPIVERWALSFARATVQVREWISSNGRLIVSALKVGAAATALGASLVGVAVAIKVVAFALTGPIVALNALGLAAALAFGVIAKLAALAAFLAPLVAVAGSLAAAGYVVYRNWQSIPKVMTEAATRARAAFSGLVSFVGRAFGNIADGIGSIVTWVGGSFGWMRDEFGRAISSIVNALQQGDLEAAAKVAIESVKVVWLAGKSALVTIWQDFKRSVLTITVGIVEDIAKILAGGSIQKVWIDVMGGIVGISDRAGAALRKQWTREISSLTKLILAWQRILGIISDDEYVATLKLEIEDTRSKLAAVDNQLKAQKDELQAATNLAKSGIETESADRLKGITAAFDAARKAMDAAAATATNKAADDLAEARQELDAAIAAANAAQGVPGPKLGSRPGAFDGLEELLSGGGLADKIRQSVAGTFNVQAAFGLGAQNPMERTAKATESIDRNVRRLVQGGGVFD